MDKLSTDEARNRLREWADFYEIDPDGELFDEIVKDLTYAVRCGRVKFEEEEEAFYFNLRKPVVNHGGEEKAIVKLSDASLAEKRSLQDIPEKKGIDLTMAALAKYTDFSKEDIGRLASGDQTKINAIIVGFFVQILPEKKV